MDYFIFPSGKCCRQRVPLATRGDAHHPRQLEGQLQAHRLPGEGEGSPSLAAAALDTDAAARGHWTLYTVVNNLRREALGRGPRGKPGRKWGARPAPAASAAQPS